jgi:hypothetical protein
VFQSYSAYGEQLERLNAEHLLGATAPDNILFALNPIDGRLPSLDDALSWPILLGRYALNGTQGEFAILRKRANAASAEIHPLRRTTGILGANVPVPPGEAPLWARVHLTPSIAGQIASALFATPEVQIEFTFADGRTESYRFIASIGEAGFVIAPVVRNTGAFVQLMSRSGLVSSMPRPVSFRIVPTRASAWAWSHQLPVEFSAIDVPSQK